MTKKIEQDEKQIHDDESHNKSDLVNSSKDSINTAEDTRSLQERISDLLTENKSLAFTRNFGIIAHVDAGKTTTTEHVLVCTGIKKEAGAVHIGATTTDFREDERKRGITISSASIFAKWILNDQEYEYNVVDTPGHADFNIEVEKSLTVLDGAILVIDGKEGVQTQTRTVIRQAISHNVSLMCFINKLDGLGANFDRSIDSLKRNLPIRALAIQMPIGIEGEFRSIVDLVTQNVYQWERSEGKTYAPPKVIKEIPANLQAEVKRRRTEMLDVLAEYNDEIAEKIILGEAVAPDEIYKTLRSCVVNRQLMLVVCGAAFKNIGIEPLLDAIARYLPNPVEACKLLNREAVVSHKPNDFVAFVFNLMRDKYRGALYFVRVYSGMLSSGQRVYNSQTGDSFIIRRMSRVFANQIHDIEQAVMGDIVVVHGVAESVKIGDTLVGGNPINANLKVLDIKIPVPVIGQVIVPASRADSAKLDDAMKHLLATDLSLQCVTDPDTNQIELRGMGVLHIEIVTDQLKKEHGINITIGNPSIKYVETISKPVVKYVYEHKKQSGGSGQYAKIIFSLTPLEAGTGNEFENKVVGGDITASFIRAVEQEFFRFCKKGATLKQDASIVDMRMTLLGGEMHSVDSNELSFKLATAAGLREAIRECEPILLEPIMLASIEMSGDEYIGAVNGLIGRLEGIVQTTTSEEGATATTAGQTIVIAEIPYRTAVNLISDLRSLTRGTATYTSQLSRFAPVHKGIIENI